jgi:hypothetical protein
MKMMRSQKKFGRCRVSGHGTNCEVSRDIQASTITRTEDKRTWKRELSLEFNSCPKCGSTNAEGYNWVKGLDGKWYHECWDCESVFVTDDRLEEENV